LIEQEVIIQTQKYLSIASDHFDQQFKVSEINFKLRGTTAGYFKQIPFGQSIISYNAQILEKNTDDFIARTVPHEVAHLVAFKRFGRKIKPHGDKWKLVMALFGADDSRCHDYDLKEVKTRIYQCFDYHCGCQDHQLTAIRHNRILSGQNYLCKKCRQPLSFIGSL